MYCTCYIDAIVKARFTLYEYVEIIIEAGGCGAWWLGF